MIKRIFLIFWCFSFVATCLHAQEIYLDGVQKCGTLYCYPALDDPLSFYYVPANPRIAEKNGRPQFSFMKYARLKEAEKAGTKETEGGGLVHFLATYGVDKDTLQEAEADLQTKVPGAKIVGPVAFRRGTYVIVTAFTKENKRWVKTVAVGKAPLMEGQKTAVSFSLTKEGAELLWENFKMDTSDISLVFEMEFAGYRKPFEAEVIIDWSKVFQNHRVQAGFRYLWFGADIDLLFQELRRTGAIKVIMKGADTPSEKLIASIQQKFTELMFEPVEDQNIVKQMIKEDSYSNLNKALEFILKTKKLDKVSFWKKYFELDPFWYSFWSWCPEAHAGFHSSVASVFQSIFAIFDALTNNFRQDLIEIAKQMEQNQQKTYSPPSPADFLTPYDNLCAELTSVCTQIVKDKNLVRACPLLEEYRCNRWAKNEKQAVIKDVSRCTRSFFRCFEKHSLDYCVKRWDKCMAKKKKNWKKQTQILQNRYLYLLRCVNTPKQKCQKRFARCMDKGKNPKRCLSVLLSCSCPGKPKKKPNKPNKPNKPHKPGKPNKPNKPNQKPQPTPSSQPNLNRNNRTNGGGSGNNNKPPAPNTEKEKPGKPAQVQKTNPSKQTPKVKKKKTPGISLIAAYRMRHIKQSGYFYYSLKRYRIERQYQIMSVNIGGLYQRYGHDKRIFRAILLDDPVFKQRNILVTIDGQDSDEFANYVNAVTVELRKHHQFGDVSTDEVVITPELFDSEGNAFFLRYGWKEDHNREAWLKYQYRVVWHLKGGIEITEDWRESSSAAITITPPFRYLPVTIEGESERLGAKGVRHAVVTFISKVNGHEISTQVTLKNTGKASGRIVNVPVPRQGDPPLVLISWHLKGGKEIASGPFPLKGNIIYWDELPEN